MAESVWNWCKQGWEQFKQGARNQIEDEKNDDNYGRQNDNKESVHSKTRARAKTKAKAKTKMNSSKNENSQYQESNRGKSDGSRTSTRKSERAGTMENRGEDIKHAAIRGGNDDDDEAERNGVDRHRRGEERKGRETKRKSKQEKARRRF